MANRPPRGTVDEVAERRAQRVLDRIAERHAGDPSRLAGFVEEQRQAEEIPGPVSLAVRQAIVASGLSVRELARQSGLTHGQLARFVRGERTLTLHAVDRLAPVLRLNLTAKGPTKRPRKPVPPEKKP